MDVSCEVVSHVTVTLTELGGVTYLGRQHPGGEVLERQLEPLDVFANGDFDGDECLGGDWLGV